MGILFGEPYHVKAARDWAAFDADMQRSHIRRLQREVDRLGEEAILIDDARLLGGMPSEPRRCEHCGAPGQSEQCRYCRTVV